jgi:hypothetical protein
MFGNAIIKSKNYLLFLKSIGKKSTLLILDTIVAYNIVFLIAFQIIFPYLQIPPTPQK